jgi:hypothetical protein
MTRCLLTCYGVAGEWKKSDSALVLPANKKTRAFRNKLNNERLRAIYVCCSGEAPNTLFRRASGFRLWITNSLLPHAFCFKAERGS